MFKFIKGVENPTSVWIHDGGSTSAVVASASRAGSDHQRLPGHGSGRTGHSHLDHCGVMPPGKSSAMMGR